MKIKNKIFRTMCIMLVLFLTCALWACSGDKNSDTSNSDAQESKKPSEVTESKSPEEGRGDEVEEQIPAGADQIAQGVFYYDLVELSGDAGDGISPREGAVLVNNLIESTQLYSDNGGISSDQCIYISFDELAVLDSAMGRECYIYSVGLGTPQGGLKGEDYQVIYRVSVDYSGDKTASIYEDFNSEYNGDMSNDNSKEEQEDGKGDKITEEKEDGKGDKIENNADIPEWGNEYTNQEAYCALAISNFDGKSFKFEIYFLRNGNVLCEGVAKIDLKNGLKAEVGDYKFTMNEDGSVIDVSITEGTEWSHLGGRYETTIIGDKEEVNQ